MVAKKRIECGRSSYRVRQGLLRDDSTLIKRLSKSKARIVYTPEVVCLHIFVLKRDSVATLADSRELTSSALSFLGIRRFS